MRMRIKNVFCALIVLLIFVFMTSCSKDAEIPEIPDSMGKISCISRESGSGTRDSFEKLISSSAKGTNIIATSTDDVNKFVSNDINAIGYVAFSTSDISKNKHISVNGIKISKDTIKKGKYPLTRNYYLCYNGQLSGAANDFLKYIMGAGQKIADQEAVSVKKTTSFLSDKSKGTVIINGSTSVAPLIEKMSEDYKKYNPDVTVKINVSDSTAGLTSAIRGECDFAMSSRELESYEDELLTKKTIARDGIAVVINTDNPITDLSENQLKKIYDGTYSKWQNLKN